MQKVILRDQLAQRRFVLSRKTISASVSIALGSLALMGTLQAQTLTSEYQWWARNVAAFDAHNALLSSYTDANGITRVPSSNTKGKGVTIAVVDTGVYKHSEFAGRLLTGADFTTLKGGDGTSDQNGHGTHVAGAAAASLNGAGVVGIAPEAFILPIRVLDRRGSGSLTSIASGINYGVNYWNDATADRVWLGGTRYSTATKPANQKMIFSMSLGASADTSNTMLNALKNMAANGSIAIIAAGNEYAAQPAFPARHVTASGVAGYALAVGAVDSANNIAAFSNKAGAQRDYYIVAPGVNIYSTYNNGGYATLSGTSMATPVVSGAAAVVWGAWPYLSGDRVIKSLLWSATDLGTPGVDTIYGWGLLNVSRALEPLGNTCATTGTQSTSRCSYSGSSTEPLSSTQTILTTATYGAPSASGSAVARSNAKIVGYDQLGRAFMLPVATVLKTSSVNAAGNMNKWMTNSQPVTQTGNAGTTKFAMQGDQSSGVSGFSFTQAAGYNSYIMAFKGSGLVPFGLSHSNYFATAFVGGDTMKIPYLGLMESPTGFAYGKEIQNGISWKMGYMAGGSSANQYAFDPTMPQYSTPSSGAMIVEMSARKDKLQVIMSAGRLRETGAFLGATSQGTQSAGNTWFTTLSTIYSLGNGYSALSTISRGVSKGDTNDQAAQFNTVTQSYSVGLLKEGVLRDNDQVTVSFAMPSRVSSGLVNLQAGVGVNWETGDAIYGTVPVSLTPDGRERRLEFSWNSPLKSGNLGLTFMHRIEPNHDASAKPENIVGARLSKSWQ